MKKTVLTLIMSFLTSVVAQAAYAQDTVVVYNGYVPMNVVNEVVLPGPHATVTTVGFTAVPRTIVHNAPVVATTHRVVRHVQPIVHYAQPVVRYTQPVVRYTQPVVEYAQPVVQYAQPVVQYVQPSATVILDDDDDDARVITTSNGSTIILED